MHTYTAYIFFVATIVPVHCYPSNIQNSTSQLCGKGLIDGVFHGLNLAVNFLTTVEDTITVLLPQMNQQTYLNESLEDANLNITQLVRKYGYPIETHNVITKDGYEISMHRIPHGKQNDTEPISKPLALLMHGILDSSDSWVLQGPDKALAYILADAGVDVWMGNARGNKYALKHTMLSPNQSEFWEFTWEEIGLYDLPSMIDHALRVSGKDKLYYIGYSQGTTSFYVMDSMKPEYNEKVSMMFALAPVAWTSHTRSPLLKIFSPAANLIGSFLWDSKQTNTEFLNSMSEAICSISGMYCNSILYMAIGSNTKQLDKILPIIKGHMPTTSSTLQLLHYGQLMNSGRFCRFDRGTVRNLQVYGTESPPDYNLSGVTIPMVIFYSENDWISDPDDVKTLEQSILNIRESNVLRDFNHMDFIYGESAKDVIYSKIVSHIFKNNISRN